MRRGAPAPSPAYDGYQGSASIGTLGEVSRPNTEDVEIRYRWIVSSREFRKDSSGAGKWRGGPGFHWEAVNLGGEAGMHTGAGHGETTFSHGALGGKSTPPNICHIVRNGEPIRAKVHRLHQLKGGDHVVKDTGGGGGVGKPEERDPQAVWEDVYIHELVSIEAARELYKVVIDAASKKIDGNGCILNVLWSCPELRAQRRVRLPEAGLLPGCK